MKRVFQQERFHMGAHIERVTAGPGGEALLLLGTQKVALLDCGMAFCGAELVENVKTALEELGTHRTLDYILLSHTHYDHVGGLSYLKEQWPNAVVQGSSYAKYVLERQGALKVIRELSVEAADNFKPDIKSWELDWEWKPVKITYGDSLMKIEQVLKEGDRIDLGNMTLCTIETPGHTNCSISFLFEEEKTLLASETLGCYTASGNVVTPILKSYKDTLQSIEKCRKLEINQLISPHYCRIPEQDVAGYWDKTVKACELCKNIILESYKAGNSQEEILKSYTEQFWIGLEKNQQPKEAFLINAKQIIAMILKEFGGKVRTEWNKF